MTIVKAWRDGVRRVNRAPAIIGGTWLLIALYALPLALNAIIATRNELRQAIPVPLSTWFSQQMIPWIEAESAGPVLGVGQAIVIAVESPLSFLVNESRIMVSVLTGYPYLLIWLLLSGGAIDRYARNRPTHAHGFFAASGVFVWRFLRLGIVMLAAYGSCVYLLRRWPFALWPALAAFNLLFDYTQVRAVVEDRRSMSGALLAAASFIRRNWSAALAIYVIDCILLVTVVAVYVVLSGGYTYPGGYPIGSPIIWHEQLFVLGWLWVRLVFWSTETALFQSRLAHAGYVAGAEPVWPDSPNAEAIGS